MLDPGQRHYHARVAIRQHELLHRTHRITSWLFGLTAVGALTQSEAYRLHATSERLVVDLQGAIDNVAASSNVTAVKTSSRRRSR